MWTARCKYARLLPPAQWFLSVTALWLVVMSGWLMTSPDTFNWLFPRATEEDIALLDQLNLLDARGILQELEPDRYAADQEFLEKSGFRIARGEWPNPNSHNPEALAGPGLDAEPGDLLQLNGYDARITGILETGDEHWNKAVILLKDDLHPQGADLYGYINPRMQSVPAYLNLSSVPVHIGDSGLSDIDQTIGWISLLLSTTCLLEIWNRSWFQNRRNDLLRMNSLGLLPGTGRLSHRDRSRNLTVMTAGMLLFFWLSGKNPALWCWIPMMFLQNRLQRRLERGIAGQRNGNSRHCRWQCFNRCKPEIRLQYHLLQARWKSLILMSLVQMGMSVLLLFLFQVTGWLKPFLLTQWAVLLICLGLSQLQELIQYREEIRAQLGSLQKGTVWERGILRQWLLLTLSLVFSPSLIILAAGCLCQGYCAF